MSEVVHETEDACPTRFAILSAQTPKHTRQTGSTKTAAPHGRTLSSPRRVSQPRRSRIGSPVSDRARARPPATRVDPASSAKLCRAAAPPTVIACPSAVFRQEGGKSFAGCPRRRPEGAPSAHFVSSRCSHSGRSSPSVRWPPIPAPALAAGMKVVIVVGPVGSQTADYRTSAQALRVLRPLLRRVGHRDLQPVRHVVEGQERGPGREPPDLPRPRQRLPQPVRRLPALHEGRPRASTPRPATATTTPSTGASTTSIATSRWRRTPS